VSADEIQELYQGLKKSNLNQFDMMLSGYIASKDAVEAVGAIGRDLKLKPLNQDHSSGVSITTWKCFKYPN